MADLLLYVALAAVGYFLASKLSGKTTNVAWVGKIQMAAIILLVFTMGVRIGCNEEVISNLNMIGVYALIFTIVTMICSVLAITLLRKLLKIDKKGRFLSEKSEELHDEFLEEGIKEEKLSGNVMSLMIVVTVSIGLFCGYYFVEKLFDDPETFTTMAGNGIRIGLCLLLFLVGFEMGLEGTFINDFKKAGIKVLAFPLTIGAGTLVGAAICGLVIAPLSMREALAIGGGFGWYSFAPVVILERGFVMASAISFMHNILRELLSLLFIPLVARKIGYLETLALPACCASDVCLPIVSRSTRSGIAIYSFISGVTLSALVPILVPILIG
ncbi:uncharacterized membrane protein YbjE (DUF340 family) [Clostridiales Family XIII bacterium PM5-7]